MKALMKKLNQDFEEVEINNFDDIHTLLNLNYIELRDKKYDVNTKYNIQYINTKYEGALLNFTFEDGEEIFGDVLWVKYGWNDKDKDFVFKSLTSKEIEKIKEVIK